MIKYNADMQHVRPHSRTYKMSVTAVAASLTMEEVSKGLKILNNGSKVVYISFDGDFITADSYPIASGGVLDVDIIQVKVINAICGGTDVSELRILETY